MRISAGGSRKGPGWDLQSIPLPKCKSCWSCWELCTSQERLCWSGVGEETTAGYLMFSKAVIEYIYAKDSSSQPDLCQQDDQMPHVSWSSWSSDCDRNPVSISRTYFSCISRAQQPDSKLSENQNPPGSAEAGIWKQKELQHVEIWTSFNSKTHQTKQQWNESLGIKLPSFPIPNPCFFFLQLPDNAGLLARRPHGEANVHRAGGAPGGSPSGQRAAGTAGPAPLQEMWIWVDTCVHGQDYWNQYEISLPSTAH